MTSAGPGIPWSRLLAEGAVIVVSILLAFAIDAWWDSEQDRTREEWYLSQLQADLERTLENIARFGSIADNRDSANARLVRSYYEAEAPSRDSLATWVNRTFGYRVVQPRLGTVEALVSTGDLALIRDDSLRAAIPGYLTIMRQFEAFEDSGEQMFIEAYNQLVRRVDPVRLRLELLTPAERDSSSREDPFSSLPAGTLRPLPPVDLVATVRTPEVQGVFIQMEVARIKMRYRHKMRSNTEGLLDLVRAAQAGD